MKKSNLALFLYFSITAFGLSSGHISVAGDFVECLSRHNITTNESSNMVFTHKTTAFTTVLQSYIRNSRFNTTADRKPEFIFVPKEDAHVSAAIVCAVSLKIPVKIRSGGHDYEGISYVSHYEFAVLDMSNLRSIHVDVADETAWVGSGAILGELYYSIWKKSETLAFPAGVCPTVGVGGHISGGGYGNMLRKYGLTIDHVVDARIVVSNGSILDRDSMGEDLFWAIRGGGAASFGVVLAYQIKLVPVPETVTVFQIEKYRSEKAAEIVYEYQENVLKMDDELFIRVLLQPVTRKKTKTVRATFIGLYLGRAQNLLNITTYYFPKMGLTNDSCHEMSWIQSVLYWDDRGNFSRTPEELLNRHPNSASFLKRKSDYVKTSISTSNLSTIFDKMIETEKVGLVFNSYGGFNSKISESATPFPHRNGTLFKIQYSVNWDNESDSEHLIEQSKNLYNFMTPFVSQNPRESYLNYRDLDIGYQSGRETNYQIGETYGKKYFKDNFYRLVKIKTKVDPDNFFRNEQSIPTRTEKRR